jgi:ankyrin repeat protein
VNLQIKQILKCTSEKAIRNRLGKLPSDLKAAYDEIYNEIKDMDEHDKALADRAFMWAMCACKPLSSEELISAIRLDPEKDTFDLSDKVTESQLLHLCNNLLVLDSQRNVWRFSHLSVTEYFEENDWDLWQAHCYAAKICLRLLFETYKEPRTSSVDSLGDSHDHESRACDIFDPKHPLQKYSRHHWIAHIHTQEEQEADHVLADLLKAFLRSPGESTLQYRQWYLQVKTDRDMPLTSVFYNVNIEEISPENSTVFAMCRFSFYTLLSDWWRNAEIPLPQMNSKGDNLLTLAAATGCKPICEALMKRGAQVNLQSGKVGSALAAAARASNIRTVKYLIEQGADVNLPLQTGWYGSALAAAAWALGGGSSETVKYLVEQGADVNLPLQTGECGSALAGAARAGNTETVKYLVEQGADVNLPLQTGRYGSALAGAARAGNTETVKYLVEQGADVNLPLQTGQCGSALAAAAWTGNTETVKYLVEQGADVNLPLQTGHYGSALTAAAYWGWKQCVESLIDAGAKIDLRLENGPYSTALHASQADISQEDRKTAWWDRRGEERQKRDKAEVAELLQRERFRDR